MRLAMRLCDAEIMLPPQSVLVKKKNGLKGFIPFTPQQFAKINYFLCIKE